MWLWSKMRETLIPRIKLFFAPFESDYPIDPSQTFTSGWQWSPLLLSRFSFRCSFFWRALLPNSLTWLLLIMLLPTVHQAWFWSITKNDNWWVAGAVKACVGEEARDVAVRARRVSRPVHQHLHRQLPPPVSVPRRLLPSPPSPPRLAEISKLHRRCQATAAMKLEIPSTPLIWHASWWERIDNKTIWNALAKKYFETNH